MAGVGIEELDLHRLPPPCYAEGSPDAKGTKK